MFDCSLGKAKKPVGRLGQLIGIGERELRKVFQAANFVRGDPMFIEFFFIAEIADADLSHPYPAALSNHRRFEFFVAANFLKT
jgi:hypothetical protein